jgi:hypothetical protein
MRSAPSATLPLAGTAGLLTLVIGTFLPWLRSGGVHRNSYASFGLVRRLIGFHGLAEILVRGWPLLGAACAGVVLVAALGLHRAAAALALVVGAWSAAVGGSALARGPVGTVQVDAIGPVVTLVGAATTVAAAILTFITQRPAMGRDRRDRASGHAQRPER